MGGIRSNVGPGVSSAARVRSIGAVTLAVLILVQAFLAGRHLFGGLGITIHGVIGNAAFALGVVLLAASLVRPREPIVIAASASLTVLLTAQVGLGYAGRTNLDAAAWHIPNGVLSFGLAVYLATRRPTTDMSRSST